ncbi:MAG TPA: hypothetical protein PKZ08_11420, partial [Vicinamibacterales bacterium]|nr:hypothetical protein [Vicinamibacterales bacterium]
MLAIELGRLGLEDLPLPARRMLAARVRVGGLRDHRFGISRGLAGVPEARAPEQDERARAGALLAWIRRAQPRAWETYPESLDDYPLGAADLGWLPGFGPSDEAQATFDALVADWEGFERIFRTAKPKSAAAQLGERLAQDVVDWRAFRDAWEAGTILPVDIGGKLLAETARARRIRGELSDAKIIDPEKVRDIVAPSVDRATGAGKVAKTVDDEVRKHAWLDWLTDPKLSPDDALKR